MAYREVDVIEVREILRAWLAGRGQRKVAEQAGVDRKTVRRYVAAAEAAGLVRDGGEEQLTGELIGQVVAAVRPDRQTGHGTAWETLEAHREQISQWVGKDPVGVGTTHLASALGHTAVRRRHSVLMLRADALFKRLKAARLDDSTEAEMRRLTQVQLLLIDDFALQPLDATETADFYELVVARHHQVSTVLTSNRTADEWLGMMSDPRLAQSAVDLHRARTRRRGRVLPTPPETRNPAPRCID